MYEFLVRSLTHLLISAVGVLAATLVGALIGIALSRVKLLANPVIGFVEILQTIPSLAMLSILFAIFKKLGNSTAIIAIFFYSLLPIVRNTYTGVLSVDPSLLEVGRGMGMSSLQILLKVQIPNAISVIVSGMRISLITAYGIVTISVLVGGGGLGKYVYRGTQMQNMGMLLTGAIPICLMAFFTDLLLNKMERRLAKHQKI